MGRVRVELKRIEKKTPRLISFAKRKSGLVKKAYELSTLCDTEVALIIFSPADNLFVFSGKKRLDEILRHFIEHPENQNRRLPNEEVIRRITAQFALEEHYLNQMTPSRTSRRGRNIVIDDRQMEGVQHQINVCSLGLDDVDQQLMDFLYCPSCIKSVDEANYHEFMMEETLKRVQFRKQELESFNVIQAAAEAQLLNPESGSSHGFNPDMSGNSSYVLNPDMGGSSYVFNLDMGGSSYVFNPEAGSSNGFTENFDNIMNWTPTVVTQNQQLMNFGDPNPNPYPNPNPNGFQPFSNQPQGPQSMTEMFQFPFQLTDNVNGYPTGHGCSSTEPDLRGYLQSVDFGNYLNNNFPLEMNNIAPQGYIPTNVPQNNIGNGSGDGDGDNGLAPVPCSASCPHPAECGCSCGFSSFPF